MRAVKKINGIEGEVMLKNRSIHCDKHDMLLSYNINKSGRNFLSVYI